MHLSQLVEKLIFSNHSLVNVPMSACPCVHFRLTWLTGCLTWALVSTTRYSCRMGTRTLTLSRTSASKICERLALLSSVRHSFIIKMGNNIYCNFLEHTDPSLRNSAPSVLSDYLLLSFTNCINLNRQMDTLL